MFPGLLSSPTQVGLAVRGSPSPKKPVFNSPAPSMKSEFSLRQSVIPAAAQVSALEQTMAEIGVLYATSQVPRPISRSALDVFPA